MQNHPQLLRRPLPPKLPKLPLRKKKVHTAKTGVTDLPHVKFTQDETTLIKRDKTNFPDVSKNQSQTPVNIQNLSLDHHVQERVTTISALPKSSQKVCWNIPETATGSIFFPSCHSASSRVFGKETNQMKTSRKPKEPSKMKKIYIDNMLKDILILSSEFSKPSNAASLVITPKLKKVYSEHLLLPKARTYTFKHTLIDLSAKMPRPFPRIMPVRAERWQSDRLQQNTTGLLSISNFTDTVLLPLPILPRKPQRQSLIEICVTENENVESVPKQSKPTLYEGLIKSRKKHESEASAMHGEGFKTVAATRYETITAMTNLAVVNCQIYGRNALNLKVFCLKHLQILILRNNPIKVIPSEIQQLKFLRVFNIAFNLITTLPPGSLKKLNVDGNDLTAFPPGILKLNLKKILFENNFTHPSLWKENSLNSPQRLTHLTSLFFLKNNLHKYYDAIPVKIQTLLNWYSSIACCLISMYLRFFLISFCS
uniref:Leucine rich repeat containing 63 n=1 Tax=Rousettus aegyptiacus TaxID=9407 RepID=A0A7J8DXX4_ROUAE|nr:leucine rich repeat containing 63 [Rousettus aegyptiacus]